MLDGTSATSGGTGDYTGSDCLHHTPIAPVTGSSPDSGDVTWTSNGTTITIYGVVLGGGVPWGSECAESEQRVRYP